jgi:hypothetical protein
MFTEQKLESKYSTSSSTAYRTAVYCNDALYGALCAAGIAMLLLHHIMRVINSCITEVVSVKCVRTM